MPGSRRYADPTAYLIAPDAWPAQRDEFCALVGVPADAEAALARAEADLHTAASELDGVLAGGRNPVRLDEAGELVIGPLSAEDLPAEVDQLRDELTALLPFAPVVSVLIELDRRTGFLNCFTHAGGATPRSRELKEYGLLRRTIYAARYLAREDYRRKISRQLNKGESIHALRRDVFYAHEGAVRRRHLQEQTDQAWCLTITTNAISTWTAEYLGLAVAHFRDQGRHIDDEVLAHISPAQSESIGLFGTITVDIDAELAQLGPTGHRPLRQPPALVP